MTRELVEGELLLTKTTKRSTKTRAETKRCEIECLKPNSSNKSANAIEDK